ncbi:hypothetical protein GCM10023310_68810 [Paenibacillus vulneris]|uniref:Uncharacterized protein n=1 Tax=Paenibacillus vulneris TaxID=1133364 RepID=A0ABW3UJA6_9BACL
MNNIIEFKSKPTRNLYIVDDYHVVLAHSEDEALRLVQDDYETDEEFEVRLIDDQKEVHVIKSGKVEIILWEREPKPLERLSFKLKVRDFIDGDLKRYAAPSFQDILEDRGAIRQKK